MPNKIYQSNLDTKERFREMSKDVYNKRKRKKTKRMCQQEGGEPHPAAPNYFYCNSHLKMRS